jgi:sensor histidine kinase YesM
MFSRMANWYRGWEEEQLRVLDDPAAAREVVPGLRHLLACQLAQLSPVERQQLRDFSLKYRGWRIYAAIARLVLLFSACGVGLYFLAPHKGLLTWILVVNALGLITSFIFLVAYFNYRKMVGGLRNQQYENTTARLAFDAERERAARELSEARLRMLHAQIEPHFLFNTLGAVQQLAEKEAPRAAELTANLIAFLRGSLGEMRSERVTLAVDFGMIDAYLKVMAVRQGERLRFTLDLPAELAAAEVPSMMLLTLVENAIKHGIEPSLRGGAIHIGAARQDGMLALSVRDTGAGLAEQPGAGEGLSNVRKRLQLLYGAQAALTVSGAEDGSVLAQLTLPLAEGHTPA